MKKILIIQKRVGIGDFCVFLPIINQIAKFFNNHQIDVMTQERTQAKEFTFDLNILVSFIPLPKGDVNEKLEALIIDSWFDQYLGVVSLVRVVNGILVAGEKTKLSSNKNIHSGLPAATLTRAQAIANPAVWPPRQPQSIMV